VKHLETRRQFLENNTKPTGANPASDRQPDPSRTPNGRKKLENYLYSHFSPLVDTIGNKKPAVKRVFEIFSLCFRDLACFVDAK
jgi:hypothetical protein